MPKVTLSLDEVTLKRLDQLARPRAGNKSFVVREAVRLMAESEALEDRLADLEAQHEFQASMARALDDIRTGRVFSHRQAQRLVRPRQGR
jgi:predicted transcriptional regulator